MEIYLSRYISWQMYAFLFLMQIWQLEYRAEFFLQFQSSWQNVDFFKADILTWIINVI